jgi:hypothetical protein
VKGERSGQRRERLRLRAAAWLPRALAGGMAILAAASAVIPPVLAQTTSRAAITVPTAITAEAASQVALPIGVGPPDAVPPKSFLRVRGLPPMAALSEGHSIAPGAWAVALTALPNLKVMLPAGSSGRSEMIITLVALDGAVLAEAKSSLVISAARPSENSDSSVPPPPAASMLRAGAPPPGPPEAKGPSGPVPPSAAAAAVEAKAMTPQDRERAQRLMARGTQQLEEGNVAGARLFFEQAVDAGLPQAAMALAATFDATELAKLRVRGIEANSKQARRWYERAQQLGIAEAEQRLKRLGAQ